MIGSWENTGRSLNAAASVGLFGIGALYFTILSVVGYVFVMVMAGADMLDERSSFGRYALPEAFVMLYRVMLLLAQFGLLLAPTLWIVRHWHTPDVRAYIRLKKPRTLDVAAAVLTTAALLPANIYIMNTLLRLLGVPQNVLDAGNEIFTAHSAVEFGFLVLVIAVTPAICEEILFRGYAQRTFERTIGWKSVLLVGCIFGLYHMQPLGLFTLSLLGVVFGFFYFVSGSLLPSMAAHFTNNFLVLAVTWRDVRWHGRSLYTADDLPILMPVLSALAAAFILVAYTLLKRRNVSGARSHEQRSHPFS